MPHDLALAGLSFPTLLPLFLITAILLWLFDRIAARRGWYLHVWHPSLFRLGLFTLVLSGLGLLTFR